MKKISDFFSKIKQITVDAEEKQNLISNTISDICNFPNQKLDIYFKAGKITIKGLSSGQKTNIYLKQDKIISKLRLLGLTIKEDKISFF
jgi:hypothetical protein